MKKEKSGGKKKVWVLEDISWLPNSKWVTGYSQWIAKGDVISSTM